MPTTKKIEDPTPAMVIGVFILCRDLIMREMKSSLSKYDKDTLALAKSVLEGYINALIRQQKK